MGKGWKTPKKIEVSKKKGNLFSKLTKEIFVAARQGGTNLKNNSRLKLAIERAKSKSCPKDTIERILKKASHLKEEKDSFFELFYAGLGPHETQYIVESLTENKNRTISNLKKIFSKHGGQLTEAGSVLWNFEKMCLVEASHEDFKNKDIEIEAIKVGAHDVCLSLSNVEKENRFSFYGSEKDLDLIKEKLVLRNWKIHELTLCYKPKSLASIDENQRISAKKLYEALLKDEDTNSVYVNFVL